MKGKLRKVKNKWQAAIGATYWWPLVSLVAVPAEYLNRERKRATELGSMGALFACTCLQVARCLICGCGGFGRAMFLT